MCLENRIISEAELPQDSRDEEEDVPPVDSWRGWLVVLGAFIVEVTVLGSVNMFGSLFDEFQSDENLGKPSNSKVSLVFSIANGLLPIVGLVSGRVTDRYGPRWVQVFAGVMLGVGLLTSSYCNNFWLLLFVFGTTMGLASGSTIVPGLTAVGDWFDKKRSLAIGIVASGSGLGTTGVPLLGSLWVGDESTTGENWRTVFRRLALLSIPCVLFALLTTRRRPYRPIEQDPNAKSWREIVTNKVVVLLFLTGLSYGCGYFTLVVYVPHYAQAGGDAPYEDRAKFSNFQSTLLLAIFGLAQSMGNVFWGEMSTRFGARRMFRLALVVCAVGFIAWPWCYNYGLQMAFAVVEGFVVAGCLTCFPAVAADYFAGPQLGAIISSAYLGFGAGGTVGPPISGALVDATGGRYVLLSVFCIICFLLAFVLLHFFMPSEEAHRARQAELDIEKAAPNKPTAGEQTPLVDGGKDGEF